MKNNLMMIAWKGLKGRKKQTYLLLGILISSFAFLTAIVIYSTSTQVLSQERKIDLYGQWQVARYGVSQEEVAEIKERNDDYILGTAHQRAVTISKTGEISGSIGTIDEDFKMLSRIELLSGAYPNSKTEIALATSVLDSLGLPYELGQEITIPIADNSFNPYEPPSPNAIKTVNFTLCGILPAYDIFWATKGNAPVNAIILEDAILPITENSQFQLFCFDKKANTASSFIANGNADADIISNDFAYPDIDTIALPLYLLIAGVLICTFGAISQLFSEMLRRRRTQTDILKSLGATHKMLLQICGFEGGALCSLSILLGVPLGVLLSVIGMNVQNGLSFFTVPWRSVIFLCAIFILITIASFLYPVRRNEKTSHATIRKNVKLQKKISLAPPLQIGQTILCTVIILITLSCLYFANLQMLGYQMNKDNAAINIRSLSDSTLTDQVITDLYDVPAVLQVAAMANIKDVFNVTSKEIKESKLFIDVYENQADKTYNLQSSERGVLRMSARAISDVDMKDVAAWCEQPVENIEKILSGEEIILYLPHYTEIQTEDDTVGYFWAAPDTVQSEIIDTGIKVGQTLELTTHAYMGEDLSGDRIYELFEKEVRIAGIIRIIPEKMLLFNELNMSAGSLVVSQEFLKGMPNVAKDIQGGLYTDINVKLEPNVDYTVSKSIVSIVTNHGGMLKSNSYEIVNALYEEGMSGAFVFGISGILVGALGMMIYGNIMASSLDIGRKRIGIFQAIGTSSLILLRSYRNKIIIKCGIAIMIANGIVAILLKILNFSLYRFRHISTGAIFSDLQISYPWIVHSIICIILLLFFFLVEWLPLKQILKSSPTQNIGKGNSE